MQDLTEQQIKEKLEQLWKELDILQETHVAQTNEQLMWYIGEAMGHVDNAITVIEENYQ